VTRSGALTVRAGRSLADVGFTVPGSAAGWLIGTIFLAVPLGFVAFYFRFLHRS